MVLSRIPFGWFGNALPAGLNAVIAGIGWFAVNSVSGALALELAHRHADVAVPADHRRRCRSCIAFFGHNLIQAFERYAAPVLGIIFAIACVITFTKAALQRPRRPA